jgi:hypothetical protein
MGCRHAPAGSILDLPWSFLHRLLFTTTGGKDASDKYHKCRFSIFRLEKFLKAPASYTVFSFRFSVKRLLIINKLTNWFVAAETEFGIRGPTKKSAVCQ